MLLILGDGQAAIKVRSQEQLAEVVDRLTKSKKDPRDEKTPKGKKPEEREENGDK